MKLLQKRKKIVKIEIVHEGNRRRPLKSNVNKKIIEKKGKITIVNGVAGKEVHGIKSRSK